MTRRLASITALAALTVAASPAIAEEAPVVFDQRATLEYQSWTWASPSGGASLAYTTPMAVFTFTDHTGALLGAVTTVSANEANRRAAEREAIRKGEYRYTYEVQEARAQDGTRFSFSVGQGGIGGATTTGAAGVLVGGGTSHLARLGLGGDLFELLGGVVTFQADIAYWSALASAPGAASATGAKPLYIEAWNWPLGVSWRYAPAFLPGLVVEPHVNFDWLYTAYYAVNGGARWDARNMGVEVGYHVLPTVKLRAGYALNRLAHNQVSWMKVEEVVDMKNATLGVTMMF